MINWTRALIITLLVNVASYRRGQNINYASLSSMVGLTTLLLLQKLILGFLLWNLVYESALRASFPLGMSVVCYTDTLVLAGCQGSPEAGRVKGGLCRLKDLSKSLDLRIEPYKR